MEDNPHFNKEVYKRTGDVLSVRQAADLLGVHANTIRRWQNEGKINSTRVGSRKDRKFNKNELLKQAVNITIIDGKKEAYDKYFEYFKDLFKRDQNRFIISLLFTLQSS